MIVTVDHLRRIRPTLKQAYCVAGMKRFAEANNLDFNKFVTHGLPVSDFDHVKNDPMVSLLIKEARNG